MPIFDVHAYFGAQPLSSSMATTAGVVQTLQRYNTDAVVLFSTLAAECDFVAGNRLLHPALNAAGGLFGWAMLNSGYPDLSQEEQRKYLGKREFVGAALFGSGGKPVTLDDAREVLNAQRRYTKPVALSAPDGEAVHAAARMATEFPSMKFLLLGMGGDDWRTGVAAARQHLNIFLELSGSLDADKVAFASATLTPRKLLYGSGAPRRDPAQAQALVMDAPGLTNSDRNRILFQNAGVFLNVQSDAD